MKMPWEPRETPPNPDANAPAGDPPKDKTPAELIAEALQPIADSFNAKFAEFNTKLEAMQPPKRPEPQPNQVELASVHVDEDLAFAQRMSPIAMRQLELEARIVKNDIKAEYITAGFGDLWQQFQAEIDSTLDGSPVVNANGTPLRGDATYIRNVVDMVIGRNARKSGIRFDGAKKSFVLEAGTSGGGNGPAAPIADGLTNEQRRVMERMGITAEAGAKTKAKLHFVN